MTTFLESISTPVQTFHSAVGVFAGTTCFLDELTVAHIGLDGKYASDFTETVRRPYTTPVAGGKAATQPWNTAMVVSLRTQKKRGLASNGRMYWPAIGATIQTPTGRISPTDVGTRLAAAKVMFDAINASAQIASNGLRIYVLSKGSKDPDTGVFGTGWSAVCTEIRSDQRLDSIERRENDQPPVWVTQTITP